MDEIPRVDKTVPGRLISVRPTRYVKPVVERLKLDPQTQLNPASRVSAVRWRESARDYTEGRRVAEGQTSCGRRICKILMVEDVEEVRRKLHPNPFSDVRCLAEAKVQIPERESIKWIRCSSSSVRRQLDVSEVTVSGGGVRKYV